MSLFRKFLHSISEVVGANPLAGREAVLAQLNPDKIYVENVRSLLGISHRRAVQVCETAVRQGIFARGVEVLCPDLVVAASAPSESQLPPIVSCWIERDGEFEQQEFETATLPTLVFYRLLDGDAPELYRQTA